MTYAVFVSDPEEGATLASFERGVRQSCAEQGARCTTEPAFETSGQPTFGFTMVLSDSVTHGHAILLGGRFVAWRASGDAAALDTPEAKAFFASLAVPSQETDPSLRPAAFHE